MVLLKIEKSVDPLKQTFLELVTKISPAILSRVTLYTQAQLFHNQKKTGLGVLKQHYKKAASYDGGLAQDIVNKLEVLSSLHGIRVDLQVLPVDPLNDSQRLFRLTEYSGYANAYVPNNQEIIDAVTMAYGNTLAPAKIYLPLVFRLVVLESITMAIRDSFQSLTNNHLAAILFSFRIQKIEQLRIDFYPFILDAVPGCKIALASKFPFGVLSRLSLVPFLVDGGTELSDGVDITMLLLMVYDALHMAGIELGHGSSVSALHELAGRLLSFMGSGSLDGLREFYEYYGPVTI